MADGVGVACFLQHDALVRIASTRSMSLPSARNRNEIRSAAPVAICFGWRIDRTNRTDMPVHVSSLPRNLTSIFKAIGSLWRWFWPTVSPRTLLSNADALADSVRQRELRALRELGGYQLGSDQSVVDHVAVFKMVPVSNGGSHSSREYHLGEVGEYFRNIERTRTKRLVILGAPGAGKTILSIRLILDELHNVYYVQRRADVAVVTPIPVRINASGWDGTQDITKWIVYRLAVEHKVHPRVGNALIDRGWILPLIDGLDELSRSESGQTGNDSWASSALLLLNGSPPWNTQPMAMTCRSDEYAQLQAAGRGLRNSEVIEIQRLTPADTATLLHESLRAAPDTNESAWEPVLNSIGDPASVLSRTLTTPWMVTLTIAALRGGAQVHSDGGSSVAEDLANCTDVNAVEQYLFRSVVPAALAETATKNRPRDADASRIEGWLRNLASSVVRPHPTGSDSSDRRLPGEGAIGVDRIWTLAGAKYVNFVYWFLALAIIYLLGWLTSHIGARFIDLRPPLINFLGDAWSQMPVPSLIGMVLFVVLCLAQPRASSPFSPGLVWRRLPMIELEDVRRRRGLDHARRALWLVGTVFGFAGWLLLVVKVFWPVGVVTLPFRSWAVAVGAFFASVGIVMGIGTPFGSVAALFAWVRARFGTTYSERLAAGSTAKRLLIDDLIAGLTYCIFGAMLVGVTMAFVASNSWYQPASSFGAHGPGWWPHGIPTPEPYGYAAKMSKPSLSETIRDSIVGSVTTGLLMPLAFGLYRLSRRAYRVLAVILCASVGFAGPFIAASRGGETFSAPLGAMNVDLSYVLVTATIYGISAMVAILFATSSSFWRNIIGSLNFKMNNRFSPRPAAFLDWCHGTGILRMNGLAYEFRHLTFVDWLLQEPSLQTVSASRAGNGVV